MEVAERQGIRVLLADDDRAFLDALRELIESAIASDDDAEDAAADNIIVLDDVTPGYERVDAALRECDAGLSVALRLLQGPMASGDAAAKSA